jgi:hypothetical protein
MSRLRLTALLALLAATACNRKMPMPDPFAASIAGWGRTALRDLPASRPPDAVPAAVIDRIRAASYEGPGKLEARLYALSTPAAALNLAQRWAPRADTIFFYRDRFFVVVQWQTANRKALQSFVSEFQSRMGPQPAPTG